eukprot:TRINITY_DN3187_c0_g1_i1.p1 TRINITY_DN3187_c0_g1~~TRINITY_DN3187_c0_g1_i1.p1  ORF type:complete len:789 (-),score=103.91 TRINITY_DN3187_c0_g1_i1:70-2436(-)
MSSFKVSHLQKEAPQKFQGKYLIDPSTIRKTGFLTKLGGNGLKKNWRTRWFVLTNQQPFGPRLYYFKNPQDNIVAGIIPLADYEDISQYSLRKYCLKLNSIHNSSRVYYLQADSKKDYEEWSSKITESIQEAKKQSLRDSAQLNIQKRLQAYQQITVINTLILKVIEARHLPTNHLQKYCDPFCLIKIEGTEFRTVTAWKTTTPVWNETFKIQIHEVDMANLVIDVWNHHRNSQASIIGRVSYPIVSLQCEDSQLVESWHSIQPADSKGYVAGSVKLKVCWKQPTSLSDGILLVKVVEARNLASKDANGLSDPYVELCFQDVKKKTKVKKKTLNPIFNEEFDFVIPRDVEDPKLIAVVWDWDRLSSNDFMGQVEFFLETVLPDLAQEEWYTLNEGGIKDETQPNQQIHPPSNKELGEVRLGFKLTTKFLLPVVEYNDLLMVLLGDSNFEVVRLLSKLVTIDDLEDVGNSLVRVFEKHGQCHNLIHNLIYWEIEKTNTPEVMFRGNTLTTKVVDGYMKLRTLPYLHRTLKPLFDSLLSSPKMSYELDPTRLKKGEDLKKNAANLLSKVTLLFNSIVNSIDDIPAGLRWMFSDVRTQVVNKWNTPEKESLKYKSVSGFYFLRLFGPALLSPKLFGLMDVHPKRKMARALTLLAKILQNLGNLVEFGAKEPYMADMNSFITSNIDQMKSFIDLLTTIPEEDISDPIEVWYEKEMSTLHNLFSRHKTKIEELTLTTEDKNIVQLVYEIHRLDTLKDRLFHETACLGSGINIRQRRKSEEESFRQKHLSNSTN